MSSPSVDSFGSCACDSEIAPANRARLATATTKCLIMIFRPSIDNASSLELFQFLAYDIRGQGQVLAVLLHQLLAFLAEDETDELTHLEIHLGAGLHAHPERLVAPQRISAVLHAVDGVFDVGPLVGLRHREDLDVLRETVVITRVSDRIGVLVHRIEDLVRLEVGGAVGPAVIRVGVKVAVPLVARLQDLVGELDRGRVAQAVAVHADRLVGPLAGESQLAPFADVAFGPATELGMPGRSDPAAITDRTEDAVELLHRDPGDGIVLVDDDHQVVLPSDVVVRAGENRKPDGLVALQADVTQAVVETWLVVDADVRQVEIQTGNRDG